MFKNNYKLNPEVHKPTKINKTFLLPYCFLKFQSGPGPHMPPLITLVTVFNVLL